MHRLILPLAFMVSGFAMGQSVQHFLNLYVNRQGFVHPSDNPNIQPPAVRTSPTPDIPVGQCILSVDHPFQDITIQGLDEATITWTSIFPDQEGAWNHLISCTIGCEKVTFRYENSAPTIVDFRVCGTPVSDQSDEMTRCRVLRLRNMPSASIP